ncbi:MAG: hypothetical protein ACRDHK_14200, partial [Actinomycetota bacterium]
DGTWAVGRYDTATGRIDLARITTPKADERDSLLELAFAPDGSVWTGSSSHLHRVDPTNMTLRSFPLPKTSMLSGGVYVAPDGGVWYAVVTQDVLVRLDPSRGQFTEHPTPSKPFGPLHMEQGPSGAFLTATYGDTYASLNPGERTMTAGPKGILDAPVGLTHRDGILWAAEMGWSTVARVDLATGSAEHFPTSPSPYYQISGPSDILVAKDGGAWFVQHFADKVARLDPVKRTLHEWEVPSAPGTNMQYLAEAPDGTIWFAEWSANKLGRVRDDGREASFTLPEPVSVQRGGTQRVPLSIQGEVVVNGPEVNLTATWDGSAVVVDATKAEAGNYNVLVAEKQGKENLGRFLEVQVVEPVKSAPGPEAALVALLLVG